MGTGAVGGAPQLTNADARPAARSDPRGPGALVANPRAVRLHRLPPSPRGLRGPLPCGWASWPSCSSDCIRVGSRSEGGRTPAPTTVGSRHILDVVAHLALPVLGGPRIRPPHTRAAGSALAVGRRRPSVSRRSRTSPIGATATLLPATSAASRPTTSNSGTRSTEKERANIGLEGRMTKLAQRHFLDLTNALPS